MPIADVYAKENIGDEAKRLLSTTPPKQNQTKHEIQS